MGKTKHQNSYTKSLNEEIQNPDLLTVHIKKKSSKKLPSKEGSPKIITLQKKRYIHKQIHL